MASDLSQEALAVVGFSWITKLWKFIQEVTSFLRPMAEFGGMIYFIRIAVSFASKIFRLLLVLYTRPGESFKKALKLSISGQSRRTEMLEEQMNRLIDQRVNASVDTEMAVLRARIRQEQ